MRLLVCPKCRHAGLVERKRIRVFIQAQKVWLGKCVCGAQLALESVNGPVAVVHWPTLEEVVKKGQS